MTNTVTNQKSQTSYKAQKIISNVIIYAFLIFLLLLSIVPFYLVVVNATHSSFDIVTKLNLLPGKNTLENYTTMQSHVNIWRGFLNSLCVAVPFTFFTGYFGASSTRTFTDFFFALSDFGRPIFAIAVLIPPQQQYTYCEAESKFKICPSEFSNVQFMALITEYERIPDSVQKSHSLPKQPCQFCKQL